MDPFGSKRKQTKKSCLGNAVVAVILAIVMAVCIFNGGEAYTEGLLFGIGLMLVVALYWVYRWYKFEDKDFNDPFHFNR